jgi:opacity protein-like surface antigen
MRILALLAFGAASLLAQPVSFGIRGGVPLTNLMDSVKSGSYQFSSNTSRYVIGPTLELRLPFGLGLEADVLYRHLNVHGAPTESTAATGSSSTISTLLTAGSGGSAWEFPLLAKYRFKKGAVRPFVSAGMAFDRLAGVKDTVSKIVSAASGSGTSASSLTTRDWTKGYVMGVGLDLHAVIHILPELRYTRWGAQHFLDPNGGIHSNQNQAEFLVGLTF